MYVATHPRPVPAMERVLVPVQRRGRGHIVEGTTLTAHWARLQDGGLAVELVAQSSGETQLKYLGDLEAAANKNPGGLAGRILRAVVGL